MSNEARIPGEFVNTVTCKEVLVSTGIQLVGWANDLAFTDAAYGENWCVETANRMATLSEVLNLLYKELPRRSLELEVKLPAGVVGVMTINPAYDGRGEVPPADGRGDDARDGVDSLGDSPF